MACPSPLRTFLRVLFGATLVLALTFGPAGTFAWPEAWALIASYGSFLVLVLAWLKRTRPGLMAERATRHQDAKGWDRLLLGFYTLAMIGLLVVAGLDAVRYGWSRVPLAVELAGFGGLIPSAALITWALTHNAFASEVVRIQRERGHQVCSSGPYAHVRHPMYTGVIFLVPGLPLSLGSYYALVPAVVVVVLFVTRTILEDRTLLRELPGYEAYARSVRHRLIPGIW